MRAKENNNIGNNTIFVSGKNTVLLGAEQVYVGIKQDAKHKPEGKQVHNIATQHKNWFILDLETGKRGWFPGCTITGNIIGSSTDYFDVFSDDSLEEPIARIAGGTDVSLFSDVNPRLESVCQISFEDKTGFIEVNKIINIKYK